MVDLHVHSIYSDGSFSPKELVCYALTHNITAFALTDHDSTDGIKEAVSYATKFSGYVCDENPEGKSVEVIPGVELSTEYEGREVHIVGLFLDYENPMFQEQMKSFLATREGRNEKMCQLLRGHGISITYEELLSQNPNATITRAHFARFLLEHGFVKSYSEAFDRYVGDYACCYVPREKISPMNAISFIHSVGGIAVLAHPTLYHMNDTALSNMVELLKENGLNAIEGIYSTYSISETRKIQEIAKKNDLLISGGSDFHGINKPGLSFGTGYGKLYIHESILDTLRNSL